MRAKYFEAIATASNTTAILSAATRRFMPGHNHIHAPSRSHLDTGPWPENRPCVRHRPETGHSRPRPGCKDSGSFDKRAEYTIEAGLECRLGKVRSRHGLFPFWDFLSDHNIILGQQTHDCAEY